MTEDTDRAEIRQALDRLYAYSEELDETWPEGTSKADATTCFYNIQEECVMLYDDGLSPSSLQRLEEECGKAANMWTQLPTESKTEVMMELYNRFINARNRVVLSVGNYVESHPEDADRPSASMDLFETVRSFLEMFDAREDFSNVTPEMEAKMRQWATERNMTLVEGIPLYIQIMSRILSDTTVVILQESRRINEEIRQLYSNANADDDEIEESDVTENQINATENNGNQTSEVMHNDEIIAADVPIQAPDPEVIPSSSMTSEAPSTFTTSTVASQMTTSSHSRTPSTLSESSDLEMSEEETPPLTSGQPVKRKARQNSKPKPKKAKK